MPKQKQVRIGIVGLGPRGRLSWMKNLLRIKTCRVTALCDKVEALVGQAYREAGDPDIACYTDYEEMLAKADIDAVAIVTAPHDQPDLICQAMEAGKHACCEVSLTYDMDDLWRVVVAVERSGLKFQMAEQVMYHAFVNAWRQLVHEGELGHVIFAEGQYLHGMTPDRFWVDSGTGERIDLDAAADHPRAAKSRMWNWFPHPILYMATDLGPILTVLEDRVTQGDVHGDAAPQLLLQGHPGVGYRSGVDAHGKGYDHPDGGRIYVCDNAPGSPLVAPGGDHREGGDRPRGGDLRTLSGRGYAEDVAGEFRRRGYAGDGMEVFSGRASRGGPGKRAWKYGLFCVVVFSGRDLE